MKKEIVPEVLMHKKFLARCKFRALVRKAMANAQWLAEFIDVYEGDDVKRRVAQAVQKSAKKTLLTITDKALLNKPAEERTEEEKRYIYRIIGGLKCFKRYPDKVKKKLAAVTYFKYYNPGRVIVREKQEAFAMYFIVSGEVDISQLVFDDVLRTNVVLTIGHMSAGDIFGEVSLLHNIPRSATATTVGHCEFLMLMKDDFNYVLKASVQKDWDKVLAAMSSFSYFEALDEVAMREGCIVAKMKSYNTNETILGDGAGIPNYVYFLLEGQCQMIESFRVIIRTVQGRNTYELFDSYIPREQMKFSSKFLSHTSQEKTTNEGGFSPPSIPNNQIEQVIKAPSKNIMHKVSQQYEKHCSLATEPTIHEERKDVNAICVNSGANEDLRSSLRLSVKHESNPLVKYRTYFMQVCRFNPGSTFGFGENMRDRRILALTPVNCLLLPIVWLLQRNSANIWTRIRHYLDKAIPSKKQMFKTFVEERRWMEYRDQVVGDVVARSKRVNFTSVHDVPYSIRMEEMYDI